MSQSLTLHPSAAFDLREKAQLPAGDTAFRAVLAKHDDYLLADVGLSRADALGPVATFWSEWAPHRALWRL
jgi:hypothetical protein